MPYKLLALKQRLWHNSTSTDTGVLPMPEQEPMPDQPELTAAELINLCVLAEHKLTGQMKVISNEDIPLTGYDPEGDNGRGVRIERGNTESLVLHLGLVDGVQQARQSLAQAASYIGLHEELRMCPYVVGVTFKQLAQAATRFGFRTMEVSGEMDEEFRLRLETAYRETQRGDRGEPLEVAMIYMSTQEFIERYASPQVGRDPRLLASALIIKATTDPEWAAYEDPTLAAIRHVIETLPSEDPGADQL
jgi:hypothetical protein